MRGGVREGAGRKSMDSNRKIQRSIYISDKLYDEIMDVELPNCESFSQRCQFILESWKEEVVNKDNFNSPEYSERKKDVLKFIDLFAGIGGIRKGFEDESTISVFSSEWDKYSVKTYEANYNEKPYGDITKIHAKEIPEHDVLLAGFPCQPFSNIGKREGFAHPTQGTLFFDVLRILEHHMPKMFLLENVSGLLTIQGGDAFRTIIDSLKQLGYDVYWDELDAQNFGLPQVRRRVIIVGFHPDLKVKTFKIPTENGEKKAVIKDVLETGVEGYSISEHLQKSYLFKKDDGKPQLVNSNSETAVKTLVASYHKIQRLTGTFVEDGSTGLRLFSELECKRIMGFPDDFIVPVSRTQMYRQFGNSVAVPMIKAVADEMKLVYKQAERNIRQK